MCGIGSFPNCILVITHKSQQEKKAALLHSESRWDIEYKHQFSASTYLLLKDVSNDSVPLRLRESLRLVPKFNFGTSRTVQVPFFHHSVKAHSCESFLFRLLVYNTNLTKK